MFYLICYFNFTFIFPFVCFVLLSKGLKFKAHTLYVGTCQPALLLNVMKSFCWSEPCVPNCMYIPLSMLWILTVHKKYEEENSGFGCISINLEEKCKRVLVVWQICIPKCSWVLTEFLLQFTKGLTQFVVFDWLQSCSSVGLHCASLLAHSLPQSEAPPSAFKSFSLCFTSVHITSTSTGRFHQSVYNRNISITVKRSRTWCI